MNKFAVKSRFLAIFTALFVLGGLLFLAHQNSYGQLWTFRYNPYALLSLIAFVLGLSLLLYFTHKPARTEERLWLALFLAALCVFSGAEMMQRFSSVPDIALFWTTMSAIGLALFPPAVYLFTLAYTNQSDRRFPGLTMVLLTTSFIITFFYAFTSIVFNNDPAAMKLYPWGYNNDPAAGLALTLVWVNLLLLLAVARLISFRRHTRSVVLRKQSLIFISAILIPVIGGTITDGILPLLGIESLPPMAAALASFTGLLLTIGVLRYQLVTISPTLFSEAILSIVHEAVVVTDAKFKILYLNPEAEKLLDVQTDAKDTLSLLGFISPGDTESFRHAFESSADGTVKLERIDICRSETSKTPVRVTSSRLQSTDLDAHVVVLIDITNELHAQSIIEHQVQVRTKQLHEARAYLVASINSLEQGFILVDHKGNVQLVNGRAVAQVKKSHKELLGQSVARAVEDAHWNVDVSDAVAHMLKSKRSQQLEAATADGLFYTNFVTPILSDETVLGASIIIEDVTEQRILERSKDEFFSLASHELRTPLTAIRGNMSLALDMFPAVKDDKDLGGLVRDAHDASLRLIEIVNDFLDSSRLEQGKMGFDLRPIGLKKAALAVRDNVSQNLHEHQNTLKVVGLNDTTLVQADDGRVRQILYNLLTNASKYSEKAVITVSGEVSGQKLRIVIVDTGKGISPENQKYLFHKFQQAGGDILTRDNTKGAGLGLYISRLLARNMGGDVALERSEVGKGSTFVLTLPLSTKTQLAAAEKAPTAQKS